MRRIQTGTIMIRVRYLRSSTAIDPQCTVILKDPISEAVLEPCEGSRARELLGRELRRLVCHAPVIKALVGCDLVVGEGMSQHIPFEHQRRAAFYSHVSQDIIHDAIDRAVRARHHWEWKKVDERCRIFEKAASLMAGPHRQRIMAAAMIGQGMNAIQAELNICQLIDYIRFNCKFLRDLTLSRCVIDGGPKARNINHYYGLEGFFAAITPSDSLSNAAQLALTPALMGNCVVWKPSDYAVLSCYRVLESFISAGLPGGVINFVPSDKNEFLSTVTSRPELAGITFGGSTQTLECIHKRIGENIECYDRFPRIVGTGSGKNFHIVHQSADLDCAVSNTMRASFEMAGQKTTSCSRVYVEEPIMSKFLEKLVCDVQRVFVTHPLDMRCFTSSLVSQDAFSRVVHYLYSNLSDPDAVMVIGGRATPTVGYYVEPTVFKVNSEDHPLLTHAIRGPLLAVHPFQGIDGLAKAVGKAPYAVTGAIFAKDAYWTRHAVSALRDFATLITVNDRCSEEHPAHQSLGGSRKSGPGTKAGSISYLLSFCTECSLREALVPCTKLFYDYMTIKEYKTKS